MKNYTIKELEEIFYNNFDCYADNPDKLIPAMSRDKYLEIINKLRKEGIRNNE
jgi:hypothetical protein